MPQFMIMILESDAEERRLAPAATKALVEAHADYAQTLRGTSAFVDGERLRPPAEGRRVSCRDGQLRVEAGPFEDRALGGYYVVEATDLDAALTFATACPAPPGAELEVRPLMKGSLQPDKTSRPGRVFAFAVLGNAPSEPGWIAIMDQIDASSRDGFPAERRRGGVRLQPPGSGRRLAAPSTGGRRAVFDGPFLESKEVIGGLFCMRMANLDEAVDWASRSEFVKHGVVEIRELWRS